MRESTIEHGLVLYCTLHGVLCFKFNSDSHAGVPDRLLIRRDGLIGFIELKQTKGRLSKIQLYVINQLTEHSVFVRVAYGLPEAIDAVDEFLLQ